MTDQRNGVTPVQHTVLDLIDTRLPQWQMLTTSDLQDLIERELCGDRKPTGPDHIRLAALALHLAERHLAKAHTGTGAITDLAALGLCSVYIDGDEGGLPADEAREAVIDELNTMEGDTFAPVVTLECFTQAEHLYAVLVPQNIDEDGIAHDHKLQFHTSKARAKQTRLAAMGMDHANG